MNINDVAYDSDAKEIVKITNMTCTLPHANTEVFNASHANGMASCVYEPSEAIALRVVGIAGKGDPVIAFTYRGVRAAALSPLAADKWIDSESIRPSRFIGRI